jgi:hypothetical protein
MDTSDVVFQQIRKRFELELLLVRYRFTFAMVKHQVINETYWEVGDNDAGIKLMLADASGCLTINDGKVRFVNSSIEHFVQCAKQFTRSAVLKDNAVANDIRLSTFGKIIHMIDPVAFDDQNSFWSEIRTQIALDLI